ncbi:MAG: hypothetical protein ABI665_25455 [Vicinamibacterales bacterium]
MVRGEVDLKKNVLGLVVSVAACAAALACSQQAPQTLTSPSATIGGTATATASDGSTLKVSPPAIISPIDGITVDNVRPTLVWGNSNGKYEAVGLAYDIMVTNEVTGQVVYERTVGESPNTGQHQLEAGLTQDTVHAWRVRAHVDNLVGPWSIYAEFRSPKPVVATPPPSAPGVPGGSGFRTPDPPAGQRLPNINRLANVQAFANLNPGLLRNSCQPEGGSWAFMDGAIDTLQAIDLRYGYNCKRGNCNDPSLDVFSYHWGAGPDEGSSQVYCTDLISGHCGSNPGLIWNDVTQVTLDSGNVCRVIFTRPGRKR